MPLLCVLHPLCTLGEVSLQLTQPLAPEQESSGQRVRSSVLSHTCCVTLRVHDAASAFTMCIT